MFNRFEQHVARKHFFTKGEKYLLAFSDSVVLAHLLIKLGIDFSIAHCNFNLRGEESNGDAAFAEDFAKARDITYYSQSFDTDFHKAIEHTNTQLTARNLRYDWFRQLLVEKKYSKIITAHHGSDNVETFLINALRGSGAQGFKGIAECGADVLRPLLIFSKKEIMNYAQANYLNYRDDSSNYQMKYERNYLRSKVVPLLKNINPSLENTFYQNARHLEETIRIANAYINERVDALVQDVEKEYVLKKEALLQEPYLASILFKVLHPLAFNSSQVEKVIDTLKSDPLSGKMFYSSTHTLLMDRETIIIKERDIISLKKEVYQFSFLEELEQFESLKIKVTKTNIFDFSNTKQLAVNADKLVFPLSIRRKKTGDRFHPFGMKQTKKLSDFFGNNKLTEFDKQAVWILENGNNEIIWVMGHRSDERYRIKGNEVNLYKIELV
jgi:tRNA(Ile)-lysidine synthase